MDQKKFKKYVVVDPVFYEAMLKNSNSTPDNSHMTEVEKLMFVILQDKKLSSFQRIRHYQELLFRNLKRIHEPEKESLVKAANQESATQTRKISTKEAETSPYRDELNALTDESFLGLKPLPEDIFDSTINNEDINNESMQSEPDDSRVFPYQDSDLLDLEKEKENLIDVVARESGGPLNFNDLEIRGFLDPEKTFTSVTNKATGEIFTIGKSPAMLEYQDTINSAKKRKGRHVESAMLAAKRLYSPNKNRSGITRIASSWGSRNAFT